MNKVIEMRSQSDWFVMNAVKEYIQQLKASNDNGVNDENIARNEAALRSFFNDIKERSAKAA